MNKWWYKEMIENHELNKLGRPYGVIMDVQNLNGFHCRGCWCVLLALMDSSRFVQLVVLWGSRLRNASIPGYNGIRLLRPDEVIEIDLSMRAVYLQQTTVACDKESSLCLWSYDLGASVVSLKDSICKWEPHRHRSLFAMAWAMNQKFAAFKSTEDELCAAGTQSSWIGFAFMNSSLSCKFAAEDKRQPMLRWWCTSEVSADLYFARDPKQRVGAGWRLWLTRNP